MTLAVALLANCSSDAGAPASGPEGGGVGAKCSADSQCTGYAHPSCVTDVKPIAGLVDAGDPKNKVFVDFHVPFPGGYCTNTVENSCTSDADCGAGAGCFRPFEGVSQTTIDTLNKLGLPFDINAFANFAVCAKTCTSASDCRTSEGYECTIPLKAFLSTINKNYKKTFCFMSVDDQIRGLLGPAQDAGP
jgi:hypothetical protein